MLVTIGELKLAIDDRHKLQLVLVTIGELKLAIDDRHELKLAPK